MIICYDASRLKFMTQTVIGPVTEDYRSGGTG